MWFFTKTIYTDTLHEWRSVVAGEYNLFDKVIVKWIFEIEWFEYEEWEYRIPKTETDPVWVIAEYHVKAKLYAVILKSWQILNGVSPDILKRYYGEFQEEFESLEQAEAEYKNVAELTDKLEQARDRADELYAKWRKIVEKNMAELPEAIKKYRG